MLKKYNIADIRKLDPCYDPTEKVAEDWAGTAVDLLKLADVSPADKLWVVSKWLDDRTNRLFAVYCAREALKLVDAPDPRSIAVVDVAEQFANGEASAEQLADAEAAAWAVEAAARTAAEAAARAAARSAAWAAAWDAAEAAARAAARAAAGTEHIEHLITTLTKEDGNEK